MTDTLIADLEAEADAAIERAGRGADKDWMAEAHRIVRLLAARPGTFTADDVMARLAIADVSTPEHRAMGSVMRTARVRGLIEHTGRYVRSVRRERHRGPTAVWQGTPKARAQEIQR